MAITSGRITITSTPTLIVPEPANKGGYTVIISNLGAKKIYLDGASVTPETGFELPNNQNVTVPVAPDESIYGVTVVGDTAIVCYLVTKR